MHDEPGSSRAAVATPSRPFCTTTTGTPSMSGGVRTDRGLGVLRLRAHEHQLGPRASGLTRRDGAAASPKPPVSRMPPARIASSPAPRAVTSTSCPARASSTANVPPSAPAPMIPILTLPA